MHPFALLVRRSEQQFSIDSLSVWSRVAFAPARGRAGKSRPLRSGGHTLGVDDGKLLAVHLLEAPDDFFRGKFATASPFVLIGVEQNVVHGKNALRDTVAVYNGQTMHLVLGHDA
jgi:hypothetical protein